MSGEQASLFASPRAVFSPCERYRYALWREWSTGAGRVLFLMLNPSTADSEQDDPTIRRCIGFARGWGFQALDVANLFAWRATDPKVLPRVAEPIGANNDAWIERLARSAKLVVCAWGKHGRLHNRAATVLQLLRAIELEPHAISLNDDGSPAHPLYLDSSLEPVPLEGLNA
jgi:hypothetical protein